MRTALLACLLLTTSVAVADDPTKVLSSGTKPTDARLGKAKTLNDYFPFTPPASKEEWANRKQELREQLLVALGLWPMPTKTPLHPVITGKVVRDGYTIEKVYFASMPGHYVTGNLYRPTAKSDGKRPAVLCPHGHWANGRFYEASDKDITKQLAMKAETTKEGAKSPLQARCANLAMMGFVVFHYDMVGYADSQAIPHATGFTDAAAELRLQSQMGLQTWNSIRALDYVAALPDVDPTRIGVTGASGGGTQTFILCALDDRPAVAFPAVMVGTAMQGGCVCENCSYLRVGTGNVEITGLFAPKPLAMSGADDWTKEILTKGLPELKRLYGMLGTEENVAAKAWTQFPHNYNQHAREFMYSWFNKHLLGGSGEVKEKPFTVVPPKELAVFPSAADRPKDELPADKLREVMTKDSDTLVAKMSPDAVRTALRAMVGGVPTTVEARMGPETVSLPGGVMLRKAILGRHNEQDAVPAAGVITDKFAGDKVVVWVHPKGKASLFESGQLAAAVKALTDAGYGVLAVDTLGTGEQVPTNPFAVDKRFAGYTFGYNRPLLANRVRDVLTAVGLARTTLKATEIHVVGWGEMGPVAVLAKAAAGDTVAKVAADLNGFSFDKVTATGDPMMLPGAVKYGGLPAFLRLCAPGDVLAYNASGKESKSPAEVAKWLVK